MGKFAKLYDIDKEQLLVLLQSNDEGEPQVACITEIDGIQMTVAPTFSPKEIKNIDPQDLLDQAWGAAEKYFESFNQEKAKTVHTGMIKQYEKFNGE